MYRHLLLLALAVLLLADAALGAPVTFDSRFAAVLPAMVVAAVPAAAVMVVVAAVVMPAARTAAAMVPRQLR